MADPTGIRKAATVPLFPAPHLSGARKKAGCPGVA